MKKTISTSTPHPEKLGSHMRLPSSVDAHRNLYCRSYDGCLDFAVRQGWDGWTCSRCPLAKEAGEAPRAEDFATAGRSQNHWG